MPIPRHKFATKTTDTTRTVRHRFEFDEHALRKLLRLPAEAKLAVGGTEFEQPFEGVSRLFATIEETK